MIVLLAEVPSRHVSRFFFTVLGPACGLPRMFQDATWTALGAHVFLYDFLSEPTVPLCSVSTTACVPCSSPFLLPPDPDASFSTWALTLAVTFAIPDFSPISPESGQPRISENKISLSRPNTSRLECPFDGSNLACALGVLTHTCRKTQRSRLSVVVPGPLFCDGSVGTEICGPQ